MRKIYVVGGHENYARWMQGKVVKNMKDANLVVFTGGEDVSPDLYGEPHNPTTSCNIARDRYELKEFEEAVKLKIPMIGICRGSQFLCVANNGRLVQHQQNPHYNHEMFMFDGQKVMITSTHHQAAYPFDLPDDDFVILGYTRGISKIHEDGNRNEMSPSVECEVVYYPKARCLGIQGHPEMMRNEHPTIDYLRDMLNKFLANELPIGNSNRQGVDLLPTKNTVKTPVA